MSSDLLVNGIDALTGRYLPAPGTDRELAARAVTRRLSAFDLRQLSWMADPDRPKDPDPFRYTIPGVDPLRLDSAGWAVIFAPGTEGEIRDALKPLLKLRSSQAGALFKEHFALPGTQEKDALLAEVKASPGPPVPAKLPYYVLLVGDPRTLPFRLQYELDVQYAVGRLLLEDIDAYASYARGVVAAEAEATSMDRRLTFFAATHANDRPTARLRKDLIAPLAEALKNRSGWTVRSHVDDEATKVLLRDLLGGPQTPSILFTGSHGLGFHVPEESLGSIWKRQSAEQGGLICHDWPGPKSWEGGLPPDHYFTADDVAPGADLRGLLAFLFACYGAGTPERDGFSEEPFGRPARIASAPFVARLPQRLLAQGARAVVGHVDRAWTTSFSWDEESQPEVFQSTLQRLLEGEPLGWAMEYLNVRYAELAVSLSETEGDWRSLEKVDPNRLGRLWRATSDARNFVVLGDPAVRFRRIRG